MPRYAVSQHEYDITCVGSKALRLLELRNLLQPAGLDVENTVSLPFGAVKQLLESHYENAAQCRHVTKVQQSIDELMDDHGAGSAGAAEQNEKVNRQLFEARCAMPLAVPAVSGTLSARALIRLAACFPNASWRDTHGRCVDVAVHLEPGCRHALRGTTLPELAKTELVEAFLEARMPMPTDVEGWSFLEAQIADAISHIYTPHSVRSGCSTLLKEPVSVLLRDRRQRDYDFTAFVDAAGVPRPRPASTASAPPAAAHAHRLRPLAPRALAA